MELEIKLKNYLNPLLFVLVNTIVFVFLIFKDGFDLFLFQILGMLWLIFHVPGIILHIQYLYLNKGFNVKVYDDRIILSKDSIELNNIESQEIDYVYIYKAASLDDGYFHTPQTYYHYAEIFLKSGKKIHITSLLSKDVEKSLRILKDVKIYIENRFFCLV